MNIVLHLYLLVLFLMIFAQFSGITSTNNTCLSRFTIANGNSRKCMDCKICPGNNLEGQHEDCKAKNPNIITGQGFAWCTGLYDESPSCSKLIVKYGNVNCSNSFHVSSKCTVHCNAGYSIVNKAEIICLDDLHWNTSTNDITCKRTVAPDQPTISSSHQTAHVRENTDVTLTCNNSSDLVGNVVYTWVFKNGGISNRQKTLTLNPVRESDAGSYYCKIQDRIGNSLESEGYLLDVHSSFDKFASIVGVVVVILTLVLVIFCGRKIKQHLPCVYMRCVECKSKKEVEIELGDISKLSSVDSVGSQERDQTDNSGCPLLGQKVEILPHTPSQTCLKLIYKKPDNIRPDSPSPEELLAIANNDQKALRQLLNNADLMKKVKEYLDQQPDKNGAQPTFFQLAQFMRMEVNWIQSFEYSCSQASSSPTEELLRLMYMAGQGINNFYSFLEKYPSLHELKRSINSSFLPPE